MVIYLGKIVFWVVMAGFISLILQMRCELRFVMSMPSWLLIFSNLINIC